MGVPDRASFVVRVLQRPPDEIRGVIEHVATGAKEAFAGTETIGHVIARMLRAAKERGEAAGLRTERPQPPPHGQ